MGFLTDWLTDWLKELLIEGIHGQPHGAFLIRSIPVSERLRCKWEPPPAAWNAGVFSLIRQLSETVILPIAGLILTFVATYELIQLIIEKNNLHDLDYWIFFKWIFKTACAILILSNTFNIVMAVFDVSQASSPGQPGSCKAQRTFRRPCLPTWRPRWKRWGLALCWGCGCNPCSFM